MQKAIWMLAPQKIALNFQFFKSQSSTDLNGGGIPAHIYNTLLMMCANTYQFTAKQNETFGIYIAL